EGARVSAGGTAPPGPGTGYLKRPGPPCPRPTPSFEAELAVHGDRDLLRLRARVVHAVRRDFRRVRLGDLEHAGSRGDHVAHAPARAAGDLLRPRLRVPRCVSQQCMLQLGDARIEV